MIKGDIEVLLATAASRQVQADSVRLRAAESNLAKVMERITGPKEISAGLLPGKFVLEETPVSPTAEYAKQQASLEARIELTLKMKDALDEFEKLHATIIERHQQCAGSCDCRSLVERLESNHGKLQKDLKQSYARVGVLARSLYSRR